MTAFRMFLRMALAVMLLAAGAQVAFGWPGLSHILITQETGYNNLRFYANLPDTYPSRQEWHEVYMPSNYFSWTHNRLTGTGWAAPRSGVGSKAGGPDYLVQFMDPRVVTENTMRRGFVPAAEEFRAATVREREAWGLGGGSPLPDGRGSV